MPRDYIQINLSSQKGAALFTAIGQLKSATDGFADILAEMNQQTDGTVYTDIETFFGLPAGQGQTVYNLVAGLSGAGGALVGSAVTQMLGRMG